MEKDIKERWIDVGKTIAIFAVMTDHLRGSIYTSDKIGYCTFFSVTLFVLLTGTATFLSFDRNNEFIWKKIKRRIIRITVSYIVAVFVYQLVMLRGFYFVNFWDGLIHFNVSGPHYYVLVYIQLVIISPIVYWLVKKTNSLAAPQRYMVVIIAVVGLAYLSRISNLYTNIADIYAGKLFGGSYILCLGIGMLIGKYFGNKNTHKKNGIFVVAFCGATTAIMFFLIYTKGFVLDNNAILGSVINPPGITLILYAIAIMVTVFCWDKTVSRQGKGVLNVLENALAFIGKHTLYIFLYHRLFLDYFLNVYFSGIDLWIKIPFYYGTMVLGSVLIEMIIRRIEKVVAYSYQ